MPVKLIHQNYLQLIGKGPTLLTGLVDLKQSGELYTGRIVEEAALLSRAHAIIPKEARSNWGSDTFRQVTLEIGDITRRVIEEWRIKCVLALAGKNEPGVEIRMSSSTQDGIDNDLVRGALSPDFQLQIGENGSEDGTDLPMPNTICILLGSEERVFRRELVIAKIADLVGVINGRLGWSESNQGPSDVLD